MQVYIIELYNTFTSKHCIVKLYYTFASKHCLIKSNSALGFTYLFVFIVSIINYYCYTLNKKCWNFGLFGFQPCRNFACQDFGCRDYNPDPINLCLQIEHLAVK